MSSDSWWAADSHLLIGFTNEVSDAKKHLWNPTPVTGSTASISGNLSSQPQVWSRSSLSHSSDHLSCNSRPAVSVVVTLEHFSRKRKRPSKHKTASPGHEGGGRWGVQHLLLWRTVWAGWAVSAHWMISSSSPGPVNAWTLVSDWASRWGSQCETVLFPACLTNCCSCLNQLFLHICHHNKQTKKITSYVWKCLILIYRLLFGL